jgi:predicted nucleic acid-binding protein
LLVSRRVGTIGSRILPLDEVAAVEAAKWRVPNPKPINGAYIAAIAFTRCMTLVTRNVEAFEGMGVMLMNPWMRGIVAIPILTR